MDAEGAGERQEGSFHQILLCAERGMRAEEAVRIYFSIGRHASVRSLATYRLCRHHFLCNTELCMHAPVHHIPSKLYHVTGF